MSKLWSIPENVYIFFSGIYSTLSLTILTAEIPCSNLLVVDLLLFISLSISSILLIFIGSYLHSINEEYNLHILSLDINGIPKIASDITTVFPESDTLSSLMERKNKCLDELFAIKNAYWNSPVNAGPIKITHSKLLLILNISVLVLTIISFILIVYPLIIPIT